LSKETNLENKYKIKNSINPNAILILEDGEEFHGFGIGAYGVSSGEIC
jgi:predicted transcriptional regulator